MKNFPVKLHDNVWELRLFRYGSLWDNFFIAAMLNPSLKSRFMQEFSRFSRILAGLVGYRNAQLENKKRSKD